MATLSAKWFTTGVGERAVNGFFVVYYTERIVVGTAVIIVYNNFRNKVFIAVFVKEIFQGFMLVGVFLMVLAEGALLLRTKFFATAVHEVQPMNKRKSVLSLCSCAYMPELTTFIADCAYRISE